MIRRYLGQHVGQHVGLNQIQISVVALVLLVFLAVCVVVFPTLHRATTQQIGGGILS